MFFTGRRRKNSPPPPAKSVAVTVAVTVVNTAQVLDWLPGERLPIKRAASASSGAGSGHLSHSPRSPDTLAGVKQQLEMVRPGSGMFTVFISLRGTKEDLGLQSTNYFVYFDTDLDKA